MEDQTFGVVKDQIYDIFKCLPPDVQVCLVHLAMSNCGACHPKCMLECKSVFEGSWVGVSWKADFDCLDLQSGPPLQVCLFSATMAPEILDMTTSLFWRNCGWRPVCFLSFSNLSFDLSLAQGNSCATLPVTQWCRYVPWTLSARWSWPVSSVAVVCRGWKIADDHPCTTFETRVWMFELLLGGGGCP